MDSELGNGGKALRSRTVLLIVDDDADARRLLCASLRKEHCILLAGDAGEGERLGIEGAPDAVILDLRLPPDLHTPAAGLGLLRRLRAARGTLPILVLSSEGDPAIAGESLRLGARAFLKKPVSLETLRQTLAQILPPK